MVYSVMLNPSTRSLARFFSRTSHTEIEPYAAFVCVTGSIFGWCNHRNIHSGSVDGFEKGVCWGNDASGESVRVNGVLEGNPTLNGSEWNVEKHRCVIGVVWTSHRSIDIDIHSCETIRCFSITYIDVSYNWSKSYGESEYGRTCTRLTWSIYRYHAMDVFGIRGGPISWCVGHPGTIQCRCYRYQWICLIEGQAFGI
jgi:hypothetical protein